MSSEIAVVGLSALFPGSTDGEGFWRDIVAGRDLIQEVPESHWLIKDYYDPAPGGRDMTYATRGAFLTPIPFDPMEFALPPTHLSATDTSQLLSLVVAKRLLQGLEQGRARPIDRSRTSVLLGVTSATELAVDMHGRLQHPIWARALRDAGLEESQVQEIVGRLSDSYAPWTEATFPGLLGNVVAGRIANRLNLGGTNCVVDAACASSLSALWLASLELDAGRSDLVVTGGADTINNIFMYMCFSKTTALSPTGDARPFSRDADGTVLGEGIGMLALRRLADAERDGDTIYAVLRGIGTASDGAGTSVYAPLVRGQVQALERAYADAGYSPRTVELIEAHGTGTVAGDSVELQALRQVFAGAEEGLPAPDGPACALGSIKSQIGHTKAAAGAASLFKTVMALHHKVLPPTIKVDRPHADLMAEDSPFYLNTRTRPWIRPSDHPRRASVSAFGFGGSNFHVTLEEYVGPGRRPPRIRTCPTEWVALSADGPSDLQAAIGSLLTSLEGRTTPFPELARETQGRFDARKAERLSVVASDPADLAAKLSRARDALLADPGAQGTVPGVYFGHGEAAGPVAFLFPGQGSQYPDMGADLATEFDPARAVWDAADDDGDDGVSGPRLSQVVFPPPAFDEAGRDAQRARLTRTEWAQPALGAASLAVLRILEEVGIRPAMTGGHSFGEVMALAAAGAMDGRTALRVARLRGRLMAEYAERQPGAMLAVIEPPADLDTWLRKAHPEVHVANRNAPGQVALSGAPAAIAALETDLRERGVRSRRLDVGAAFHTPGLAAAGEALRDELERMNLSAPVLPVYANATASPYGPGRSGMASLLASQVSRPVLFSDMVEAMYAAGARVFLEVGPGTVLTGLVRRILGERATAIATDRPGASGITALWHALAALAAAGTVFDTTALWSGFAPSMPPADPATRKSPATVLIGGANPGKPYPPAAGAARGGPIPRTQPTKAPAADRSPRALPSPTGRETPLPPPSARPQAATSLPPAPHPAREEHEAPMDENRDHQMDRSETAASLAYLQTLQADLTRAHLAYQQALAEGHRRFLETAETSLRLLMGTAETLPALPGGEPAWATTALPSPAPRLARPVEAALPFAPLPPPIPAPSPSSPGYGGAPDAAERRPRVVQPATVSIRAATPEAAPPTPVLPPSATAARGGAPTAADPWSLVRAIVAEKTGYPETMLEPSLDLGADLGIDSIKRVEILAALTEALPGTEPYDPARLGSLRTLADVAAAVGGVVSTAPVPGSSTTPSMAPAGPAAATGSATDPRDIVLGTVAEKTGYPLAMLDPALALDADLGIDSIKKVEIFSALQNRLPAAGSLDPQEIASLRTLDDVVTFLQGRLGSPGAAREGGAPHAASEEGETDADGDPDPVPVKEDTLRSARLRVVESPPAGLALPHLQGTIPLVLVGGDPALVRAVTATLGEHGIAAVPAPELPAPGARRVLVLAGASPSLTAAQALAVNRLAFRSARTVAAAAGEGGEGLFVTVQDTGGSFGVDRDTGDRVWLAGLTGLVKTLGRECPALPVKAIDIARTGRSAKAVAALLVRELLFGGPEIEVGYDAGGRRLVLELEDTPQATAPPLALPPGAVVLASGGGRGVTAATLIELARRTPLQAVILGRTELVPDVPGNASTLLAQFAADAEAGGEHARPQDLRRKVDRVLAAREIRATLDALSALGSTARYLAVDVRDAARVQDITAQVRDESGPIAALLHGAGVIRDQRLAEKTDEAFDEVFDTKVLGARNLLEATREDPLRHIAFFSSIAARMGNQGQADYAMANEVLGKLAAREGARRGPGTSVQAFAWGPWEGGMVTPALARHFREEEGIDLIPLDAGTRFFCRVWQEAHRPGTEWLVVPGSTLTRLPHRSAGENLEVTVSLDRQPYLADHAPLGVPVVPVALVAEWMVCASEARQGARVREILDLRVLHGIRVDPSLDPVLPLRLSLAGNGDMGTGRMAPGSPPGPWECLVEDRTGRPRYRARLVPDAKPPGAELRSAEEASWPDPASWGPHPVTLAGLYDEILFHGERFRPVMSLDRESDAGAVATLTARGIAWVRDTRTDPLLLDGGLQVLVSWAFAHIRRRSLPTGIGRIVRYEDPLPGSPVRVLVAIRSVTQTRVLADIRWTDAEGRPVLAAFGVEAHAVGESGQGWRAAEEVGS